MKKKPIKTEPEEGSSNNAAQAFDRLESALEGYFDLLWDELPDEIIDRIRRDLPGLEWNLSTNSEVELRAWDAYDPEQRRTVVKHWDYERDPETRQEREKYFELFCELDEIEKKIREYKLAPTPNATALADRDRELEKLDKKKQDLESLLNSNLGRSQNGCGAAPYNSSSSMSRTRRDAMSEEIDGAIHQLGSQRPTASKIMQMLKHRKNDSSSCIIDVAEDGVIWIAANGKSQKLTMKNLENRLSRWNKK